MSVRARNTGLTGWIQDFGAEFGALISVWRKMGGLDPAGLRQLFEDEKLLTRQLRAELRSAHSHPRNLQRMLVQMGVDASALRELWPAVMVELEQTCASCTMGKRCEQEIEAESAKSSYENYCANANRFEKLRSNCFEPVWNG